jgi:hypothetical protein
VTWTKRFCPHNPPNCQYNSNHTPVFNMPVALPCNPFLAGTTPHKAYDICLRFERRVLSLRQPSPQLVCARILGYMLIHAPVATGRDYLAQEIVDCTNDETLGKLGKFYDNHLIRLCEYLLRPLYSTTLTILSVQSNLRRVLHHHHRFTRPGRRSMMFRRH